MFTCIDRQKRLETTHDARGVQEPTKLKFNLDAQADNDFDHAVATFDTYVYCVTDVRHFVVCRSTDSEIIPDRFKL